MFTPLLLFDLIMILHEAHVLHLWNNIVWLVPPVHEGVTAISYPNLQHNASNKRQHNGE